jgi:hypothetical protein
MRGIKVDETPIIPVKRAAAHPAAELWGITKMNQIYYNFVRPHQALKGRTPAEVAGVGIAEQDKWRGLIKRSINSKQLY